MDERIEILKTDITTLAELAANKDLKRVIFACYNRDIYETYLETVPRLQSNVISPEAD